MTCHEIESEIVDVARGIIGDPLREAGLNRHLNSCSRCARLLETERALSAALRRLADSTAEPADDPAREAAILAAFDAAWQHPGGNRGRHRSLRPWLLAAAAVLLAIGAGRLWTMVNRVPSPSRGPSQPLHSVAAHEEPAVTSSPAVRPKVRHRRAPAATTRMASGFVPLPGAATLPPFESGELLRLNLPVSVLPSLGLLPPASSDVDLVRADVLVGQDGFARAVRLVP